MRVSVLVCTLAKTPCQPAHPLGRAKAPLRPGGPSRSSVQKLEGGRVNRKPREIRKITLSRCVFNGRDSAHAGTTQNESEDRTPAPSPNDASS